MSQEDLNRARNANPIDDNPAAEVWEGQGVSRWTVGGNGGHVFPVRRIEEEGGARLVRRARPYRRGVKLDSTGAKERVWTVESLFHNGNIDEPGLDETRNLYPDVLNEILASFDGSETGDLELPTTGRVRARADSYRRTEASDADRDAAVVLFTWVEDNEDDVGASSIQRPTTRSSGKRLVQEAQFDAAALGVWDGSLSELLDRMNQIEALLNLPDTLLDDALATVGVLRRNVDSLVRTFSDRSEDARAMLLDPASSRLLRKLAAVVDMSGAAEQEATRRRRPTTTKSYATRKTIFEIAALERQDAGELMALNEYRIDDMFSIDAGTAVRVYV